MKKGINKKALILLLFISVILTVNFLQIISAQTEITEDQQKIVDFLGKPVIKQIIGIVFGLWDVEETYTYYGGVETGSGITKFGAIIVYLMIWLIMFLAFSDIVRMFGAFSEWVGWIIGAALAIAAAQLKLVYTFASGSAQAVAYFGIASVWASIIFTFVAFIAVSIGFGAMRKWAVKRQVAIHQARSIKGTGKAVEGLKALKELGDETER